MNDDVSLRLGQGATAAYLHVNGETASLSAQQARELRDALDLVIARASHREGSGSGGPLTGKPGPIAEPARDAIALARSVARGDLDGAWAVWGEAGEYQRMAVCLTMAGLLTSAIGNTDAAWASLLAAAEHEWQGER